MMTIDQLGYRFPQSEISGKVYSCHSPWHFLTPSAPCGAFRSHHRLAAGHPYLDLNVVAKEASDSLPAFLEKDLGDFETLRPLFEAVSLAIKEESSSSSERVSSSRAVAY